MDNVIKYFDEKDIKRYWKNVNIKGDTECWNWIGCIKKSKGYGQMSFCYKSKIYNSESHRISLWLAQSPQPINKNCVLHTCNNKLCCNPFHLYWGDHKDNGQDMMKDGAGKNQFIKGHVTHNRKLDVETVRNIKMDIKDKLSLKIIANKYKVSLYQVKDISRGKTYKDVLV